MRSTVGMRVWSVIVVVVAACSRNLDIPPEPPPPGPGSVYGRVVYAKPGQIELVPAGGATIGLLGTNFSTTSKSDGTFRLGGLTRSEGELLFAFDSDMNGGADRQKLISLADIGGGLGKDIALGDVVLSENARLHGKITRGDVIGGGGHGGTVVFVPEGPFTTYTNDDGTYSLRDLPEGTIRINFFRAGYDTRSLDAIALRSGEDFPVGDLVLNPSTGPVVPGTVSGHIAFSPPAADAIGTFLVAYDPVGTTTAGMVASDGTFKVSGLPPGIYTLLAQRLGYQPGTLQNVLAQAGQDTHVSDLVLVAGTVDNPTDGGLVILPDGGIGYALPDGGIAPPTDAGMRVDLDGGVLNPDGGTACLQGAPCNPGACLIGVVDCHPSGALCVATGPGPDGTVCGMGLTCHGGLCQSTCAFGAPCDSPMDLDTCSDDMLVCGAMDLTSCPNAGTDGDGDGYSAGPNSCSGDCDDTRADIHPGAPEICDGLDNNCDGITDEGTNPCGGACPLTLDAGCDSPTDLDTCADDTPLCGGRNTLLCMNAGVDGDNDGYSSGPAGCNADCNDNDPAVHPGAMEACNSRDDDCDGVIDNGNNGCGGACALTVSPDAGCDFVGANDLDTCNDDTVQCMGLNMASCASGGLDVDGDHYSPGAASCQGDCNDMSASVHPGATELCNGVDDNCDGVTDEGANACGGACALAPPLGPGCDATTGDDLDACPDDVYACSGLNGTACVNSGVDADGDKYSPGPVSCSGDCDDTNAAIHPGAPETCDFIDNNCNGVTDENCGCETFTFTGGGSTTDWQDPLNWAPNGTPGAAPNHCAVIPAGLTVTLPGPLANPLTTLTVDGTLSHVPGSDAGVVLAVRDRVQIGTTGAIDVSGKGFAGGTGPGVGLNGTSCACNTSLPGSGAGHGGLGGFSGSTAGGASYDSVAAPTQLGSGGGARACAASGPGGSGGGKVRINVTGELVLNGAVRADGFASPGCAGGGGSAGSIWISAFSVSSDGGLPDGGTPIITANGGAGVSDGCGCGGIGGGGGAGGRILLDGYSGALPASLLFQSHGGSAVSSGQFGAAGTIGHGPLGSPADYEIDNGGQLGAVTPFPSSALLMHSLRVGGQASATELPTDALSATGAVTVQPGSTLTLYQPLTADSVSVQGTLAAVQGSLFGVYVSTRTMSVAETGVVEATGRGLPTGTGPGHGLNGTSCNCNTSLPGSGAGHGAIGGASVQPGGALYGSLQGAPVDLGSGGGTRACAQNGPSGTGGGRVRLDVANELRVDGIIRANGGDSPGCLGGGGSGGSVWITAGALTTDGAYADGGTPHIMSHGGAGLFDTCGCGGLGGGGGAGGRIAVFADRNDLPASWVTIAGGPGVNSGLPGNPGIAFTFPGADSLVTLVAPADLDAGTLSGTTLQWTGYSPLGTAHFHVELDDDEHFDSSPVHPETGYPQLATVNETAGTPGGPLTTTTWTTPALDAGTQYYWHVIVHNSGNGVVAGSPTWRFQTP